MMFLDKEVVVLFCDLLLAPSMTFIRSQAEALESFTPYYVGSRGMASDGIELPAGRSVIINRTGSSLGKIREAPFKVFGWDPLFVRRIRKLNPALIHAHFGPSGALALPIVEDLHVPLIVTFHGGDATVRQECADQFHYTFRTYWKKKELLQKRSRLFIAVSEFIRKKLLEQGYPDDKTIVHYIGVDTEYFLADPMVPRQPIVLFVGRLIEQKGCENLLRAMTHLQENHAGWELVIIGDGPLRSRLEEMSRQSGIKCRFVGVQPQSVVREWMNRAMIFCAPSIKVESGAEEGFGIVFAEAQAMSLPVVSFSSGGVPEAVAHGETGLLAPERDWECLASYIALLMDNPDLRVRMSHAGRQRICAQFDLKKQTRTLESLYQEVLAGAHDRSLAAQ